MTLTIVFLLLLLGCFTGFAAGLLGIGGGMLMTPFLTMLLPMAGVSDQVVVHAAIATSLATIMFTSLSSVRAHNSRGAVRWNIVAGVAPGILVGALLGSKVSSLMPTFWLALLFACFVGFSAVKMFLNAKPKATRELPGFGGMFLAGNLIGVVSALIGAGGGFISVPLMLWCNVKMHHAVGTSAALGFPIAAAGTIGYVWSGWSVPGLPDGMLGYVHLPALFSIACASVCLAPVGAKVAHSIDTKPLKRIFACLLFVICGYMLWKAFQNW